MFLIPSLSWGAEVLTEYKKVCKEIGFEEKTEKFADCVMKFYQKDKEEKEIKRAENEKKYLLLKEQELAEQQLAIDKAAVNAELQKAEEMKRERKRKNMENYYKMLGLYPNNNIIINNNKKIKCVDWGPLGGGIKCR